MARIIRNFPGSYRIVRPDGVTVATIENHEVAELDAREWLVTFYEWSPALQQWQCGWGDIFPTLRDGKAAGFEHCRALMQSLT